jgi:hypothetical protein
MQVCLAIPELQLVCIGFYFAFEQENREGEPSKRRVTAFLKIADWYLLGGVLLVL